MTTQTEALKLALELFEQFGRDSRLKYEHQAIYKTIVAIKEALAQPEQDKERCVGCEACIDTACGRDECPKGWPKAPQPEQEPHGYLYKTGKFYHEVEGCNPKTDKRYLPLYTTPPQRTWVGLTDLENAGFVKTMERGNFLVAIYDIEKKLKEKNT